VGRHSVLWADDRDALRHSVRLDWKGPSLTDRLSDLLGRKWTLYALWVILALVRAASYPIALTAVSCSRERRKDLASMAGRKAFCWHRRRHLASHDGSVHMSVYRIPPSTVADSFRRVVPRHPARSPHHVVLHLVFNRRLLRSSDAPSHIHLCTRQLANTGVDPMGVAGYDACDLCVSSGIAL
jgi:hypothetical protein